MPTPPPRKGQTITADFLGDVAEHAYRKVRGPGVRESGGGVVLPGNAGADRRVVRFVVVDGPGDQPTEAGGVEYFVFLVELGTEVGPITWEQRTTQGVYEETHKVRPAPAGSQGLCWLFNNPEGNRIGRYWFFDEHAARKTCGQ